MRLEPAAPFAAALFAAHAGGALEGPSEAERCGMAARARIAAIVAADAGIPGASDVAQMLAQHRAASEALAARAGQRLEDAAVEAAMAPGARRCLAHHVHAHPADARARLALALAHAASGGGAGTAGLEGVARVGVRWGAGAGEADRDDAIRRAAEATLAGHKRGGSRVALCKLLHARPQAPRACWMLLTGGA